MLLSKIAEKEVEKDSLVNRLNDLERNIVPSLKKAVNDISLEKDAAAVAKVLDCLRVYGIHDSDMSNPHYHFYLVC
jgi:hypothetical protein